MIRNSSRRGHKAGDSRAVIAIVDDEECICVALGRLMRSSGFTPVTFSSGCNLLAWVADNRPDCVVLDLHMPKLDGFAVHARLQDALKGATVPVIVITGYDSPETCARALEQGVYAYLRKPVDDDLLLAAIDAALATC